MTGSADRPTFRPSPQSANLPGWVMIVPRADLRSDVELGSRASAWPLLAVDVADRTAGRWGRIDVGDNGLAALPEEVVDVHELAVLM